MNRSVCNNNSPCCEVQVPSVNLEVLEEDKMGDQSNPTTKNNVQNKMDLESHLRGLILNNGMPNAEPNAVSQNPVNLPMAQRTSQAQSPHPTTAVAKRGNAGRAFPTSFKEPNQGRRRGPNDQAVEHQYPAPPKSSPDEHSNPPKIPASSRKLDQAKASRVQSSHPPAHGQLPMIGGPATMPFTRRRTYQPGSQGPSRNSGTPRDQHLTNGQQTEPRRPYSNTHDNYAMPNSTSTLRSRNYNTPEPFSAQQSHYTKRNILNQNQFADYPRPVPQNRQLYEPGMHRLQAGNQYRSQSSLQMSSSSSQAQALFLDQLSSVEIPKATISPDELQEKETLRLVLEEVCQRTITEYERKKDYAFDETSVALKCFGSLASGFATHSADMDLALVSPHSKPEPSSPESEIPRLLEKCLLELGYGVRLLTRTRVPIIKLCEKPTSQLAAKLLEERGKYEKERDAPPKSKKAKTAAAPETPNGRTQTTQLNEAGRKSRSVSPQVVNEAKATDNLDIKTSEASAAEEVDIGRSSKEISVPVLSEVDDAKIDELKLSTDTYDGSTNAPNPDNTNTHEHKLQGPKDAQAVVAVAVEKVTDLSLFSDEELIRLYDLAIGEGWYEPAERAIIVNFKKAVEKYGPDSDHVDLQVVRSDLGTLTDVLKRYRAPPEHHLDFPKTGVGIQCDINFSNHLALHNTRLLKCYGLCDPRVRPMVLFVKTWAKRRKINSPYHGTLSSYGYVLMVLHYLVNIAQPSVAPNLQTTRKAMLDNSPGNDAMIDGYNVRFWRNEAELVDLAKRGMLTHNRDDTVGSLLRGFFQYYAQPHLGFSWAIDVLSLRTEGGLLSKAEKGWTGAKTVISESTNPGQGQKEVRHRYLFAIEDPFEVDHNIARTVVHNGIVAIRDEFRRAHAIIQSAGFRDGKTIDDLFAEAESKENLQYRAFGPLPRKDNASIRGNGKTVDDPRKILGGDGVSTHKNSESPVGKMTGAVVIPRTRISPQSSNGGPASAKDNAVSKPPKIINGKSQNQLNSRNAQVVLKTQNISPNSSAGDTASKDSIPVRQKVGNLKRSRNNGGKDNVLPNKGPLPVEQAALVQDRGFGAVFKNGKEVVGSSGRVGEAGVIPRRGSVNM